MTITEVQLDQIKAFDGFINHFLNETKLYAAIKADDIQKVKDLLENDPTLVTKSAISHIPLHYACSYENTDIVKALIDAGFDVNSTDDEGDTPLHYACYHQNLDLAKLLLTIPGIELNARNMYGSTPLQVAFKEHDMHMFDYLLNNGAQLCIRTQAYAEELCDLLSNYTD